MTSASVVAAALAGGHGLDLLSVSRALLHRISDGPVLAFFVLMLALIVGPRLAEKVRLPSMVGLVLAGMVVGPHGVRLLDGGKIALSAWGDFGLLYLMFTAGLELDLKLFARMKKAALTFAVLSFAVPFTLGVLGAKVLGYAWAGAVLMGSNWGSHTLVTYPILRGMGLARNAAVATVVGATAVTDTSALLVLTGVAASVGKSGGNSGGNSGGISGGIGLQIAGIGLGLVVLGFWTLFVLPRLGRWFFGRVGGDRSYRFVFGMMAFLSGAVLAQAASIDGIVGAFFAGLGLNRAIPERSPLMERVQFFGSALFIPIFLVSVGLLLDPRVLIDPKTLLIAAVFTVAVLGGKALGAMIAGRRFRFGWAEVGVMAGLSGSQAAATLATTLVGARLGIFDTQTVNAVLVVILVSLVVTPAMVTHFGKRVPRQDGAGEALGGAVLVPIWSDAPAPLGLAARIAADDGGIVLPAGVAGQEASDEEIASQRRLLRDAEDRLAKQGLESRPVFRVSSSVYAGLYQTMRGEGATLIVAEWRQPDRSQIGGQGEAFRLLTQSPVPALLTHGAVDSDGFQRLIVVARDDDLVRPGNLDLALAAELAARIGAGHHVLGVGSAAARAASPLAPAAGAQTRPSHKGTVDWVQSPNPLRWVQNNTAPGDLLLLPGIDAAREALERLAGFARRSFLVAIAVHGGHGQAIERSDGLVVGRSTVESGAHA